MRPLGGAALFLPSIRARWSALAAFVGVSTAAALVKSLEPAALAPALDVALTSAASPAASLRTLTLNNLGSSLAAWLPLPGKGDRLAVVFASVLLYVAVAAIAAGLTFGAERLLRRIRASLTADLLARLHEHVLRQALPFFHAARQGDLGSRFVRDVADVAQISDYVLRIVWESGPLLFVYGYVLFRTDAWLASALAGVTLLHVGITRFLQGEITRRTTATLDEDADLAARVQETIVSVRIIKSFSAEDVEVANFRDRLRRYVIAIYRQHLHVDSEAPLRSVANATAAAVAVVISFWALLAGRLTLPGFALFVYIARQAIIPLSQVSGAIVQVHAMTGASLRIREILGTAPALVDGSRTTEPLRDAIEFHDVSFGYDPGPLALQRVSFKIARGTMMAFVGSSGGGKSTVLDLVLRLLDPQAGTITYDGSDIREFAQQEYRRHFGVVPQDPLLFNSSIEENIAYGRPLLSEKVEEAARMADALEFVRRLPAGFQTVVGDRGVRLSGGQRQRVALARALYGRPEILLLDEATSSLDSESERAVQSAIERALVGTTAIVVAHRLSTILRADVIVVLEDGRVQGIGSHRELLSTNPLYGRLYRAQFAGAGAAPPLAEAASPVGEGSA